MSLIESQPINIHDLTIESPLQQVKRWTPPSQELSKSEELFLLMNANEIDLKILFQDTFSMGPITNEIYTTKLKLARAEGNINKIIQAAAQQKMLGNDPNLSSEEIIDAQQMNLEFRPTIEDWYQLSFPINLKILGLIDQIPQSVKEFYIDRVELLYSEPNPATTMFSLRNLLLSCPNYSLPLQIKNKYFEEFKKIKTDSDWTRRPSDVQMASNLSLLAAEKIEIGDKGIELSYPTSKSNLTPTPPVPIARNF